MRRIPTPIRGYTTNIGGGSAGAFEEDSEDVVAGGLCRLHLRQPSAPFPENRPPKPAVAMDGDLRHHWNGRGVSSLLVLHLPLWITRCSCRNAGRPRASVGARAAGQGRCDRCLHSSVYRPDRFPSEYLPYWASLMFLIPSAADKWHMPLLTGGICPAKTPAKCSDKRVRNVSPSRTSQPFIPLV